MSLHTTKGLAATPLHGQWSVPSFPTTPGSRKCHLLVRYALFVLASRAFPFFLDSQSLIFRKKSLRKWASVDPPRGPRRGYKFSIDPSHELLRQLAWRQNHYLLYSVGCCGSPGFPQNGVLQGSGCDHSGQG
jgi:hypothetical protein